MKNISSKTNQILKKVLEDIHPPKEDLKLIKNSMKEILDLVKTSISKNKIKASVFVGGSFAKGTLIKKDYYDIDVFVRFDKKYKDEELSKLLERILKKIKKD